MTICIRITMIFFVFHSCWAQDDSLESDVRSDIYENLFGASDDETNQQTELDDIEYQLEHPVDILTATYSDLVAIPAVSPFLAEQILLYRDSIQISDVHDLKNMDALPPRLFEQIKPFLTVNDRIPAIDDLNRITIHLRSRSAMKLQPVQGFTENKYWGNKNGQYSRLLVEHKLYKAGIVFDKDPGERFKDSYLNGYGSVQFPGTQNSIIVGNYSISAGQGLLIGRNVSTYLGTNVIGQVKKRNTRIHPSLSTDESRFFRGIAANVHCGTIFIVPFYSKRTVSATVDGNSIVTSFYAAGLFRDSLESVKHNALSEKLYGGVAGIQLTPSFVFGAGGSELRYSKKISRDVFLLPDSMSVHSVTSFADMVFGNFNWFGEAATNEGHNYSWVGGVSFKVNDRLSIAYHHRNYSRGYCNPLARPFSKRTTINDGETGNYVGVLFSPIKDVTVTSYVDEYSFPSADGFAIRNDDYFVHCEGRINRKFFLFAQLKGKWRSETGVHDADDERRQVNYRWMYSYRVAPGIDIMNRIEVTHIRYRPSNYHEKGILLLLDFKERQTEKYPVRLNLRFILFDTDSYDSRLYEYESNVPGSFSDPPLYGKGNRWYIVVGYRFFGKNVISLRYSETKRQDISVIGSGDNEIHGNLDNQLTAQVDVVL